VFVFMYFLIVILDALRHLFGINVSDYELYTFIDFTLALLIGAASIFIIKVFRPFP